MTGVQTCALPICFLAPYVYGLYWKRTTKIGAKAGMLGGIASAIILFYLLGPDKSPLASSIAIIIPFMIVPAVSLMTKKPSPRRIVKAFKGIK